MVGIDTQAPTWALVPLKSPERAKSRLAGVLSPEQRAKLFFILAERVILALRATPGIDNVAVVTSSPDITDFARSLHAVPLLQRSDTGMSNALEAGLRELGTSHPGRVLMVPGDLPLISPQNLENFLSRVGRQPGISIVPDRRRIGTNLMLCTPPHAIAPSFGGHSFERHLAAAAAAGVEAKVVQIDELALDLDEPNDLDYLRSLKCERAAALFDALDNLRSTIDLLDARPRTAVVG